MKAIRIVSPGSFCWNESCADYGQLDLGNLVKYGRTAKGTQRLKCKTCSHVFVENKGTIVSIQLSRIARLMLILSDEGMPTNNMHQSQTAAAHKYA